MAAVIKINQHSYNLGKLANSEKHIIYGNSDRTEVNHFKCTSLGEKPFEKESIRPKSIAREMFENYQSFEDYIKSYHLERSEGVLLRHLSEVYKVLAQTVPDSVKTEEVWEADGSIQV